MSSNFSKTLFILKKSPADVSNFDPDFTTEQPRLSQIDGKLLKTIDEEIFKGFSFVSKGFRF